MSTTKNLRFEENSWVRLDKLAGAKQLGKPVLAADLIREIKAAVREANAGDFASGTELAALAKKWKLNASY
jgi:RHH-type transcriptional regulator, rel operon repressor / antitoxin RelB